MSKNHTAADIKNLRERTGAGMMDVKKALDEALGDTDKALEIIRIKGLKGATKREGRSTAEGLVAAKVVGNLGVLVEINCETDFVAKSVPFIDFSQKVLDTAANSAATDINSLLEVKFEDKTIADLTIEAGALLGEKIAIRRMVKLSGNHVAAYLHKTSKDLPAQVGVLVSSDIENSKDTIHDIAVHVAALSPNFLNREEVPKETVETERRIAEETAKASGKPEAAVVKIIEGRLNSFYKENVLLEQSFAKDTKKTITQILEEANTNVKSFARFRVGA